MPQSVFLKIGLTIISLLGGIAYTYVLMLFVQSTPLAYKIPLSSLTFIAPLMMIAYIWRHLAPAFLFQTIVSLLVFHLYYSEIGFSILRSLVIAVLLSIMNLTMLIYGRRFLVFRNPKA